MSSWDLFSEVNSILTEMGGKGSGHHGHKGVKGRRGGSAPKRSVAISMTGRYDAEDHQKLVDEWRQTWGEVETPFVPPPSGNFKDMIYGTVRERGKLVAGIAAENEGRRRIHILSVVSHAKGAGTELGQEFLKDREGDYIFGGAGTKAGAAWFERLGFNKEEGRRYWRYA